MGTWFASFCLLFGLLWVQMGFIAFLPGWFGLWPLTFALGIYLFQHQSLNQGLWLIILTGLWLDLIGLGPLPLETLSYVLSAGAAWFLARHLFSNRSFAGVILCAVAAFLVLKISQAAILGMSWLREPSNWAIDIFWREAWVGLILVLLTVVLVFPFAKSLRRLLLKTFLLTERHATYDGRTPFHP